MVPSGTITHKYSNPGTYDYTITVKQLVLAVSLSTISKKITVFVAFEIPAAIVAALTNGSSRVWITDNDAPGHFGVGPPECFLQSGMQRHPNSREACAYDDEITFSKDANNRMFYVN